MSATEDDTELRDLLIQNLENSGVLNKLKAEMRAAVFLAMDEQDKVELKGLDRQHVSRELGLPPDEGKRKTPLLLELLRRGRQKAEAPQEASPTKVSVSLGKGDDVQTPPSSGLRRALEGGGQEQKEIQEEEQEEEEEEEVDLDEGDSFFDDPLPRPQKTYAWRGESSQTRGSPVGSVSERTPGASGTSGDPSHRDPPLGRTGGAVSPVKSPRETRSSSDRPGSQLLDDPEYDDDFNSHRSDISRSEVSIGEEIEEVSIEGPDDSDKVDEDTQDLSVSQMSQSLHADYIEHVA
ncbi:LOW QUALITY PROTEIN: hypothetical protein CRUP_008883 [Coryphaenoides rupestris]|nr:LOW QUALITY PROTEIN: hypothetical protein CRUP_008883 [Coryphaenoides rupestris]